MVAVDTSESREQGGSGGVEAGEYHWMIEDVAAEQFDDHVTLKVVCQVLAGTRADQIGHKQTEFFKLAGKAVDRLRKLLVATNIMTDEQWVANIGKPLEFDERLLKGRQFCARISIKKYEGPKPEHQGKMFPAMNFDIWSVWDDKAAHIPKEQASMALLGPPPVKPQQQQPAGQQHSVEQQSAPQSQQAQQSAASSAASGFKW